MLKKLLIANRGEIAIRIARTAAAMGIDTVAVSPEDDASSLHNRRAGEAMSLKGVGAKAYLDVDQIVSVARATQVATRSIPATASSAKTRRSLSPAPTPA